MMDALCPILAQAATAPGPIDPDTKLIALGLDSFAMIDLAVAIEDSFGVRIPDEAVEQFRTAGDVAAFLAAARSRSG